MPGIATLVAGVWFGLAGSADAANCNSARHNSHPYTICTATTRTDDLRLFLNDAEGKPWGTFDRLAAALDGKGEMLAFGMNAGMYHPDRAPVGLYIEDGTQAMRLITSAGPGNFGLLPNGVFCMSDTSFAVIETRRFSADAPACRYATQSGPMLVIDGELHPRFLVDATSRLIRNGVGVSADGQRAYLVISDAPVTFHEFARIFRDGLGLRDALYFDGRISRLYAPAIGRTGRTGWPLGPMIGVVTPRAN
jgi:uncharacterized protein YigE (DUF2233 family)